MKAQIGVDANSGLVHTVRGTSSVQNVRQSVNVTGETGVVDIAYSFRSSCNQARDELALPTSVGAVPIGFAI